MIDLIKKDFNSVSFFLDLNDNFRQNFPVRQNLEKSENSPFSNLSNTKRTDSSKKFVFMSPYFIFKGEEDELEFVSYSLTGSDQEDSLEQWMQIRYFIQDCPDRDSNSSSSCLMRSSKRHWSLNSEREEPELLVLLRAVQSLKFSYLSHINPLTPEWRDSWRLEKSLSFPNSSIQFPQEVPFPFRLKLEVSAQGTRQTWSFNISNFYLNYWNPFNKGFLAFPKWKPPKKKTDPSAKGA